MHTQKQAKDYHLKPNPSRAPHVNHQVELRVSLGLP